MARQTFQLNPARNKTPPILKAGAAELQACCAEVDWAQDDVLLWVNQLDSALLRFRRQQGYGRAISAPQIGVLKRLIVLNLGATPIAMINPEMTWHSEQKHWVWDDCLSVPDWIVRVSRWVSISVRYQDIHGRWRHWQRLPVDMAELVQHEMDHLDGVLMTDHIQCSEDRQAIAKRAELLDKQRPTPRLSVAQVLAARAHIPTEFLDSPQFFSDTLSRRLGCRVYCKVETVNPIRCFKGRGASFLLAQLSRQQQSQPVVAASAGNWGQALAYECGRLGIQLTVFAAHRANPLKLERMRELGAGLCLAGEDFDAAKAQAKRYAQDHGLLFVEDGLNEAVSEGHGTIAQELLSLSEPFDAFIAPLGNGALLNGMALWSKAVDPAVQLIGVCAAGAPSMRDSWLQGPGHEPLPSARADSIADGIAVRCPIPEAVNDMHGQVDDVLLVEEQHLTEAMLLAQHDLGLLLEPAGAAAMAALLAHPQRFQQQTVALVLTGANLSAEQFRQYFCALGHEAKI